MTENPNALDQARLRMAAADLQGLANLYDVTLPTEHAGMVKIAAEARRIGHLPAPTFTLPTSAAKTEAAITKMASSVMLARETQTIAQRVAEEADLAAMRLLYGQAGAILAGVMTSFADAYAGFEKLADTAPLEVTAHTAPDQAGDHIELLRLVGVLTGAAAARLRLAEVLNEDITGELVAWLVLDPRPDASLTTTRHTLAAGLPHDLTGWLNAHRIGCAMAGLGEAHDRAERFGRAVYAAGYGTPDGGLKERTYAEALALVGQPARPPLATRNA